MAGRKIGNFKIALHFCNRVPFQFDRSARRPVGYTVIAIHLALRSLR